MLERLTAQDINLEQALQELQSMKLTIAEKIIEANRGGEKGMHGFIAEAAESGIGNARRLITGAKPEYVWVNDNGPIDLMRNGVPIQQKFVRSGGLFSLNAVREHMERYPDFIKQGGKYQIPKDFYDNLVKLCGMSEEEAKCLTNNGEASYRDWLKVRDFFRENDNITLDAIEPSALEYSEVQRGKIDSTIRREEENIKVADRNERETIYQKGQPSLQEGTRAAGISAAAEGGCVFCLGVARKLKAGKQLSEFTADDWAELGMDTAKGTAQGGIRGSSVYFLTNFTATPGAVANSLVTAAFGVAGLAGKLQKGTISEEEFIIESQIVCLDVSVSAIASILGSTLIPIPVLGAVIGNTAGMFLYELAKENLSRQEQSAIASYRASVEQLNRRLDKELFDLIRQLKAEFAKFSSMLELAFDLNVNIAFSGSVELALATGVSSEKVLKNMDDGVCCKRCISSASNTTYSQLICGRMK
ncbi:MAG: hypothetical protein K2O18_15535 [Oscillospiraceae bacterium]|nr:hypothetical protein [Oscillospiraceae bacterium]